MLANSAFKLHPPSLSAIKAPPPPAGGAGRGLHVEARLRARLQTPPAAVGEASPWKHASERWTLESKVQPGL